MVMSLPRAVYEGKEASSRRVRTREYPLLENTHTTFEETEARHWESISGMRHTITILSDLLIEHSNDGRK
jgi:hypothetical protein